MLDILPSMSGQPEVDYNNVFSRLSVLIGKKKSSAGGEDKITYKMLKALPEETFNTFTGFLQQIFDRNQIQDSWRRIKIVPIPKGGGSLEDIENFRPISLISVMVKSINMVVKELLTDFLESNQLIPLGVLHIGRISRLQCA